MLSLLTLVYAQEVSVDPSRFWEQALRLDPTNYADWPVDMALGALGTLQFNAVIAEDGGYYTLDPYRPSSFYGLSFGIEGLPDGARFDPETRTLSWTPTAADVGTHTMVLTMRGAASIDQLTVTLAVSEEWETILMPGVGYVVYLPQEQNGLYQGFAVEYLFVNWVHQNMNPGPSHGRFYGEFDLLHNDQDQRMLAYLLGLSLSLERQPARRFLIPWFGVEGGGISRPGLGTFGVAIPTGGVWLWSSRSVVVQAEASYVIPIAYNHYADQAGFRGKLTLDLAFW